MTNNKNVALYRKRNADDKSTGTYYIKDFNPIITNTPDGQFFRLPDRLIKVRASKEVSFSTGIDFKLKSKSDCEGVKGKKLEANNIGRARDFLNGYLKGKEAMYLELQEQERVHNEHQLKFKGKKLVKLDELLELYLKYRNTRKKLKPASIKEYKNSVKSVINRLGNKYIYEYTLDEILLFIQKLRNEPTPITKSGANRSQSGFKDYAAKKYSGYLKILFDYAINNDCYLEINYWSDSKIADEKQLIMERECIPYEPDEVKLILEHLKPIDKDFAWFMLLTGMRPSDIIDLEVTDISILQKTVKFNINKTSKINVIPLHEDLIKIVKRAIVRGQKYVFENKGKKWTSSYASQRFNTAKHKALPQDKTNRSLYSLKKTFGTVSVNNGGSMEKISAIMGHSSVEVTKKWYAAYQPSNYRDEINIVADVLKRPSEQTQLQSRFKNGKWKYITN